MAIVRSHNDILFMRSIDICTNYYVYIPDNSSNALAKDWKRRVFFQIVPLVSWFRKRNSHSLWSSAFMFAAVAVLVGLRLMRKGTVADVHDWYLDQLHSAWFWSVLLPVWFALALAMVALTKEKSTELSDQQ